MRTVVIVPSAPAMKPRKGGHSSRGPASAQLDRAAQVILDGHSHSINHATFSPDGTKVATASADRTARIWNANGSGLPVVLVGHSGTIDSVAFSPDGARVVTASTLQGL